MPVMPKGNGMGEGDPMGVPTYNKNVEPLDVCLIRIVDTDPNIRPGMKYQYRFQVKMENPNYNRKDQVSEASQALIEVLVGDWSAPSDTVVVPGENFLYGVDSMTVDPKDPKKMIPLKLKDGQAMMQIHRWQSQVQIDKFKEPFGDFFVVDTVVSRGTYVGGKQFVNLPLWSSEFNNFILREFKDEKVVRGKDPRRGAMLDLTRTDLLVVDTKGGRTAFQKGPNRTLEDESAQEILLLSSDGTLQVRSSAVDKDSPDRISREKSWKDWISEVEGLTRKALPTTGGTDPNRFAPPN